MKVYETTCEITIPLSPRVVRTHTGVVRLTGVARVQEEAIKERNRKLGLKTRREKTQKMGKGRCGWMHQIRSA